MTKKIPSFKTDKEAETFVDTADLSQYHLSGAEPMRFELEKKSAPANMRLPAALLAALKARCVHYQRLIREVLKRAVTR